MIKKTSTFAGTAVFVTVVVGALALGVWFARALVERFLNSPHTFAGVTVTPFNHNAEGFLTHSFDSLKVNVENNHIKIAKPKLDLTILGPLRGVDFKADSVVAFVEVSEKKEDSTTFNPKFPEKLKFPGRVNVDVEQTHLMLSNGMGFEAKKLNVKNLGEKSATVKIESVEGDFLPEKISVDVLADFETENLKVVGRVKSKKDSVKIVAKAPKNNLQILDVKTEVSVANPKKWIPAKIPSAVPDLGKLNVSLKGRVDLQKKRTTYKATLKTRVGEFWPLLPLNVLVEVAGDENNIDADILLKNDEGGSIALKGSVDKNLQGFATGKVEQMSAKFGPQIMPMDVDIKSAELNGKILNVSAVTRQGTAVDAVIDFTDSLMLTFEGDISPYEPWALDWTWGNLTLGKRSKAYGVFNGHSLKILAKINDIKNAFHIAADSLQVTLDIKPYGIDFTGGIIYTPKETFDFDGDVVWRSEHPHTSWNATQRHGGNASTYISIGDTIDISVTADQVVFATIPFSDINLGNKIDGKVSGKWFHDFDNKVGQMNVKIDGELDAFKVGLETSLRGNQDTIFVDKFDAIHGKNTATAKGAFIFPTDSNLNFVPTAFLPIQVLSANISSHEFSIPLLLETLNDSTLISGKLNGDLSYSQGNLLAGNLDFFDIKFRRIPPELFNIRKLNVFAENDKVELNSYLDIGGGGWTGNTQVIISNVFDEKRNVSFSHGSDNGGTFWADGFIDNNFIFKGTADANGSWYVPKTLSEITNTDLHVDILADLKKGLKGISAEMRLDSTLYEPPKTNLQFPIFMRGRVQDGLVDIYKAETKNKKGETISATLQFSLDSMRLMGIDINSDYYSVETESHKLTLENVHSHMTDNERELLITANIPSILYKFNDVVYGKAEAVANGNIGFSIPHGEAGVIKNNTIFGNVNIDKFVFYREFDIDMTPTALDKYLTMFNNFVSKLRKKNTAEEKLSVSSPINLSLHISDTQLDSVAIVTPFATFPLTADIWVLGNTMRPLLRGDITNTNSGFIGVKDIYEFNLNSFLISWNDATWQNGIIDVTSSQDLPYCSETSEKDKETCPINLDLQGTISNLQAIPSSNCGNEASSASIYYNILLGCIAEDNGEETDWNKLAGKAIGKVISTTANKNLGGDYIGDIDMKVMLFENNTTSDKDSSYFKVPVSLDRWVKNLSLIFGYTHDQSDNPTYDQSLQFGVNYTLPVFDEKEYSHKNHLSPTLSLNGMLTSKQYLTNTGTESNESRLEKNIGVNYIYKFWNPCILGLGDCASNDSTKIEEDKK